MEKRLLLLSFLVFGVFSGPLVSAQESKDQSKETTQLKEKIRILEEKVAELEKWILPIKEELMAWGRKTALREQFNERYEKDIEKYSKEEVSKIEEMYQVANRNLGDEKAQENLLKVIEKYPESNRAGCAILYLAQRSEGKEQEKYLQTAIEKYDDCFYGNGVQVGAYARFLLAYYYKGKEENKKAEKLFDEIRGKYPEAVNHKGHLLVEEIKQQ